MLWRSNEKMNKGRKLALSHGVTKYFDLIGPLRESISLRITPFSTQKTHTQTTFKASGSKRSRQCQTTCYHTVCIATPIAEPLKCFTLIANIAMSTNDFL